MNWAFQRTGGSLWSWRHGAPQGVRAAETRQLSGGNYEVVGDSSVIRPGVPEPLTGVFDTTNLPIKLLGLAVALWLGMKVLGGKRGGYKKNPARRRPRHRKPRRGKAPRRVKAARRRSKGASKYMVQEISHGKGRWHDFHNKAAAEHAAALMRESGSTAVVVPG